MLALDTEDDTHGNVKVINFFDGVNHSTFTGKLLRERAWQFLIKSAPATCWATNTEYDLINLFGSEWVGKLCTLMYVSAGLMRATFTEAKITFYDTLRHWPASVEQMGKEIGHYKKGKDIDFENVKLDDLVARCRRDTEITWIFTDEMLRRYADLDLTTRSTLPAMAMQLFTKRFYDKRKFFKIPEHVKAIFRGAYYGGRVEAFAIGEIRGSINHYDINSLFPSVMYDFSYPDLLTWYVTKKPNFDREGVFTGSIWLPRTEIPALPYRGGSELIFPYGNLTGAWCYPEIRQLLADGGLITSTATCVEFEHTETPFKGYVDFCYKKRLEAKTDIDNRVWKLFLNSLYGKFGQSRGLTVIYNDREFTIESQSNQSNIIWSAYVTCYARLRLLAYLRECRRIFYTDTDSLFTPDRLATSTKLGELKKEGEHTYLLLKGNKMYILGTKAKAKGVKREVAAEFILTGRCVFRKPARLRESRRTGLTANAWSEVEKRSEKKYLKRKVHPDGSTEAWNIIEYEKAVAKEKER